MFDVAFDQIGHRFDAPVRMPRKSADIIPGIARVERIQHQERIELLHVPAADHAHEANPRPVDLAGTGHNPANGSGLRHGWLLSKNQPEHTPLFRLPQSVSIR